MKVLEYIQSESDRQSATLDETICMVGAWNYVAGFTGVPNLNTIKHVSYLITGNGDWRKVPAVFNQGPPAISPELVPRAMNNWRTMMEQYFNGQYTLDELMKEFLEIHPFADGNGRVASLLYNYLNGTILDPVPLPYYFGPQEAHNEHDNASPAGRT